MYSQKFDKSYQSKSPQKRQEFITRYLTSESPQRISHLKKLKKSKANAKRIKQVKKSGSPLLRNWLQKRNEGTPNLKTDNKVMMGHLTYDKSEARRRLLKNKEYAEKIAKYEEHQKIMEELEEIEKSVLWKSFTLADSPQKKISVLDCTDMTRADIRRGISENLEYLNNIISEKTYSKRHDIFKSKEKDNFTKDSLSYNVSTVAFTTKQKLWLSKKLNKLYGDDVDYQMKVLLPELCLKIFMDKYNMSYEEAYQYLDETPVTKCNQLMW